MPGFWKAAFTLPFLSYALIGALLGSVASGIVGTYVVSRRISYVAAAIAHFVLGGIGISRYLAVVYGLSWLKPFHGALGASLVGAAIIACAEKLRIERQDTVIGAVWAVGMAAGIIAISATPGYNEELVGYLFGNIFFITGLDLYFLACLDVLLILFLMLLYRPILCLCFDREWALLRGVPVTLLSTIFLCFTALTVVALVSMVGIVLVIALLTFPAAIASKVARTWKDMMIQAQIICLLLCVGGLWISYELILPAGATIVGLAAVVYVASLAASPIITRVKRR